MWREYDANLGFLQSTAFARVSRGHASLLCHPLASAVRSTSLGALLMVYNLWRTIKGEIRVEERLKRADAAVAIRLIRRFLMSQSCRRNTKRTRPTSF